MAVGSHKRNPSVNFYLKTDFQQKKDKELNLSYSQSPAGNHSTEMARGGLNNSRSQAQQSYTQSPNTGHANFRIGTLSNNISREYSNPKKQPDFMASGQINSQDEKSKNDIRERVTLPRRNSKMLLSNNFTPKTAGLESQAEYIQQRMIPSTGQSEYNLLAGVKKTSESLPPRQVDMTKKPVIQVEFKLKDQPSDLRSLNEITDRNSRKQAVADVPTEKNRPYEKGTKEPAQREPVAVCWKDCFDGQDIRAELKFGDCLGQGSFAKVYEGFDKKLKIPVAIKVIDKRKIKDSEVKKKALIEEEVYIFSKLDHPNIVKFLRLVEDAKRVFNFNTDLYSDGAVWFSYAQQLLQRHQF